jgi:glyoxylase-like metal-dependent hydrolase (beta-lactamase superfamily II)
MRRFFFLCPNASQPARRIHEMSTIFTGEYWTIQRFVSGFSNNAFLVTCARTNKSLIIDTPADPHELIEAVHSTRPEAVLITHGHQDHVEGFGDVSESFKVSVGIGSRDRSSLPENANISINVAAGEAIRIGDVMIRTLATPGHTPGSTCYLLESQESNRADEQSHVFTGDTLFPGGPGRSSSPEALQQIIKSLREKIFTLPDSVAVLPGHGEFTTIGAAKAEYAAFAATPLDPDLFGDVTWA